MSIASVRKRVSPEIHVRPALIAVHFRKFAFLHFTFSSLPYGATQHVRERLPQSEVNTLQVAKIHRLPHRHLPDAQRQEQVELHSRHDRRSHDATQALVHEGRSVGGEQVVVASVLRCLLCEVRRV